jgi:phosphatidate cytidylyltransferase
MVKDKIIKALGKAVSMFFAAFNAILGLLAKIDIKDENLKKRVISSIIMLPLAIYAIYFSKGMFVLAAVAIAVLMVYEWIDMSQRMIDQRKWRSIGIIYITIPIYAVINLRLLDSDIVFWMFLLIWTTDIGAYFTGRILGGPKLAASISPGKTWSGFVGGLIGAAAVGFLSSLMFVGDAIFFIILSITVSIFGQASDLLESKFKRIFGVKDSGDIIPGHGGVLDRLDAMMLVAPILLIVTSSFPAQFGL